MNVSLMIKLMNKIYIYQSYHRADYPETPFTKVVIQSYIEQSWLMVILKQIAYSFIFELLYCDFIYIYTHIYM